MVSSPKWYTSAMIWTWPRQKTLFRTNDSESVEMDIKERYRPPNLRSNSIAKKMNNDNFALPFAAASTACKCFHLDFEGASLAYMLHSFDQLAVRSAKDVSADFPTSLAIRLASDSKKKGGGSGYVNVKREIPKHSAPICYRGYH